MSKAAKAGMNIMSPARTPASIGKRNFLKDSLDLDNDDDDDQNSYSIAPSVPLWKTINFKEKTQQLPNTGDPVSSSGKKKGSGNNLLAAASSTTLSGKGVRIMLVHL